MGLGGLRRRQSRRITLSKASAHLALFRPPLPLQARVAWEACSLESREVSSDSLISVGDVYLLLRVSQVSISKYDVM